MKGGRTSLWRVQGEKKERKTKMGGGYSICFTAWQITGEAARLTIMPPS
jgi:hypothetical protein